MSIVTAAVRLAASLASAALIAVALAGCQHNRYADVLMPDVAADLRAAQALSIQAQEAEDDGKPDKAVDLYRQAVNAYRDFPAAWNNMGVLLATQKRHKEAFEAFATAADLVPSDPRPAASMGMIWQELGYPDEAIKAYGKALERDVNYLPALRESVRLEVDLDQVSPATAERARRALLRETDAAWRAELERLKLVIDQRVQAHGKDSGAASGS